MHVGTVSLMEYAVLSVVFYGNIKDSAVFLCNKKKQVENILAIERSYRVQYAQS